MLSAVAVGYLLTQIPGGALADRLGAKNVIGLTILGM
jgi:MFS family permease